MASEYDETLTWNGMADKIEKSDPVGFAFLLDLQYSHDDEPEQAKKMVVHALKTMALHKMPIP